MRQNGQRVDDIVTRLIGWGSTWEAVITTSKDGRAYHWGPSMMQHGPSRGMTFCWFCPFLLPSELDDSTIDLVTMAVTDPLK